jgi:hypothetical protein
MSDADQVHEDFRGGHLCRVAGCVERVAGNRFATGGELAFGPAAHERANPMGPLHKL